MSEKVLSVRNLSKNYGKKTVIRDISLEIKQGEVVGLLGPNGAGKTTCFYIIVGLVAADAGNIFIDALDITHMPMYQRAQLGLGYLPQEASIFRGMNVEDNIYSILEIAEANEVRRKEKLEELLEEFSIKHIRKSHALALSGGERRRVEIARALATNPSFILLDEPFAGVDPIAVNDIRKMVIHLKDRGIGVLITDHNVRETLSIVDRAYIVYDGMILTSGSKEEIIEHGEVRKVYLGEDFRI
ncbi:MAG: LPS export ABC transporter ATP-binding protein [Alphaproteobacteria bacterium RIFCSPLOWO2_01_FULL_40_26]|nr:MAG: LPS export ABC transporter ATP-binding protein [Alphaproteobacteria bacterium RIFCSPHIGHO2_02_FULL_40_34]OFW94194.1 MAG: LPS export ABC transporter ATP-binding protein [Alphaproteobacteria bacterium RIFCSPLOWO2_01_FULL_40_26]OFX09763.1 MAG: LPS export ABC transporter ATP-binding protein [Alphaproteobacteria bacterium RIFCSPLOWO2_02_FULL_40_19]OFX12235.1 MAG: LPS export ABC transporter ATP-binding protein [Alphaproteobacteria bacterium RIFCSPLOWO2_12_FULL_40_11]